MYEVFLQSKWKLSLWLVILLIFVISSCSINAAKSDDQASTNFENTVTPIHSDLVVSMGRSACMEKCPVYDITIKGDRSVTFTGWLNVEVLEVKTATISQEQIEQLIAEINDINFFEIETPSLTFHDCPLVQISIALEERRNTYYDYRVCSTGALPQEREILKLEKRIDGIANSQQWLGDTAIEFIEKYFQ